MTAAATRAPGRVWQAELGASQASLDPCRWCLFNILDWLCLVMVMVGSQCHCLIFIIDHFPGLATTAMLRHWEYQALSLRWWLLILIFYEVLQTAIQDGPTFLLVSRWFLITKYILICIETTSLQLILEIWWQRSPSLMSKFISVFDCCFLEADWETH